MNAPVPQFDYSATAWNETHHYSIANGRLGYRFGASDVVFSVELWRGGFTLRERWQTHRFLRVGLILIAFPLFTLGVIYARDHTVPIGTTLYIQLALIAAGLALSVRFRSIYRTHVLRTNSGDEILIFRDPNNAGKADEFISRLNEVDSPVDSDR